MALHDAIGCAFRHKSPADCVAAAVPERGPILYTAIDALNKVKAWRDCDGNDGFPHGVREQIDAVLMVFETRQNEKPSTAPEVKP